MKTLPVFILLFSLAFTACIRIDVFEKNITIPNHSWDNQFKPEISFTITDSLARYDIYVVFRHADAYHYRNIWMNIYTRPPGDSMHKQMIELPLATDDKGWMGKGMDDVYEHRIRITATPERLKPGVYQFRLENVMRENPLENVMNVGIRVEKVTG